MADSALRPDVLAGVTVLLAGVGPEVRDHLEGLGAEVSALSAELLTDEQAVGVAVGASARPDVLVVDAAEPFAAAGAGHDGLRRCVDGTWNAVRAAADRRWIDREDGSAGHPGKVLLLAPVPGAGLHARPARAAIENLARTLSTEWSRYGITTAAILPGDSTTASELGELVAFLASRAGAYYTGCAFTLGNASR